MDQPNGRIERVQPAGLPPPAGHYSPAIAHNGLLYVSGQLPIEPGAPPDPDMPIEAQVRLVLANLERVLKAGHSELRCLLSVTLYVTDVASWGAVNAVYASVLGEHRPARAIVPVPHLHYGLAIEVQAVAAQLAEDLSPGPLTAGAQP